MNDTATEFLGQVQRLWGDLSSAQKVSVVVLALLMLGLSGVLINWARTTDYGVAFARLNEEDAGAVVVKLKESNIPYQIGDDGRTIMVPVPMVNDVRLSMAAEGLPQARNKGFELFDQSTFGMSEQTQRINYQRALEGELGRTINRLAGVKGSRVHVVIPQPALFKGSEEGTTASVVLDLAPGRQLDDAQIRGIANLVSHSVEGLKPENLTIIDTQGRVLNAQMSGEGKDGLQSTSTQLQMQREFERTLETEVRGLLEKALGTGKAAVKVNARFDWNQEQTEAETLAPPPQGSGVRSSREIVEKTSDRVATAGGVPGTASNIPTYQETITSTTKSPQYERRDVTTNYEFSKTVLSTRKAPGKLERLSVAVVLDGQPEGVTSESIVSLVSAAVGLDSTRGDAISVSSMPFPKVSLEEEKKAMEEAQRQEWILSWAKVAAMVVGPILLLLLLRLLLRPSGPVAVVSRRPFGGQTRAGLPAEANGGSLPEPQPITANPYQRRIRQQVATFAQQEPTMVSKLISSWLEEDKTAGGSG